MVILLNKFSTERSWKRGGALTGRRSEKVFGDCPWQGLGLPPPQGARGPLGLTYHEIIAVGATKIPWRPSESEPRAVEATLIDLDEVWLLSPLLKLMDRTRVSTTQHHACFNDRQQQIVGKERFLYIFC